MILGRLLKWRPMQIFSSIKILTLCLFWLNTLINQAHLTFDVYSFAYVWHHSNEAMESYYMSVNREIHEERVEIHTVSYFLASQNYVIFKILD